MDPCGSLAKSMRMESCGEIKFNQEDQMEREHLEWDPADFLSKAVKWEMAERKDLSYGAAFAEIQKKYPGMAKRFQEQLRGKWPPKNLIPVK